MRINESGDQISQTLILNFKFPSLNDALGKALTNRYAYGTLKKGLTRYVAQECKIQRLKREPGPLRVEFHWQEKDKRRDLDNVASAKKFILDGLQEAGVIKNDNAKYIKGFSDTFSYGVTNVVKVRLIKDGVFKIGGSI